MAKGKGEKDGLLVREEEESPPSLSPAAFLIALALMVLLSTGERITFKIMVDYVPSYGYFLNQVNSIAYIIAFFIPVTLEGRLTAVTSSLLWKFAVMGVGDGLATILLIISGSSVSGPLQILLLQGLIPFTVVGSMVFLRRRYLAPHYLGSLTIIAGIVICLVPDFGQASAVGWSLVFLGGTIPASLGSIFKEHTFMTDPVVDINMMNAWVSFFQTIVGFVLAPAAAPLQGLRIAEVPQNFADGFRCIFLQDTALSINGNTCDSRALISLVVFLAFNICWNFFILVVMKYGSATLVFVGGALAIPLCNLSFSLPFIEKLVEGKNPITVYSIMSMVVTLAGLIIYRLKDEPAPEDLAASEDGGDAFDNNRDPEYSEPTDVPARRDVEASPRQSGPRSPFGSPIIRMGSGTPGFTSFAASPRTSALGSSPRTPRSINF